jgi:hypothetical protein
MVANRQLYQLKQPASLRRQAGMGWLGWTTIALMAGVIGLFALRLVPIYIDYFQVLDVARTLQREPGVAKKGKNELKTMVSARFRQNNLYSMKPTVLKFTKTAQQRLIIHIDYEERVNLFANIDVVAKFDEKIYPR